MPNAPQDVPLTAKSWQQSPDELDIAYVEVVVTDDACVSSFPGAGQSVILNIKLNGSVVRATELVFSSTWTIVPLAVAHGGPVMRTLTVDANQGCDVSGSFTINSLDVDVVGYR